tara:strand:- start:311 stop:727 length:417 start_codon:yes stop_codon:yes gene_type:complete
MAEANGALVSLYTERNNAIKNKGDVAGLNAEITKYVKDNNISKSERQASSVAASNVQSKSKGGDMSKNKKPKGKVPVIAISIGMAEMPKSKKKTAMMRGGMSGGKEHMYAAGGMVKDNPGLKALKAASPEAYNKITKS